ncbi:MAG: secretin N-terminal domain-containing protein, partial [candidate division WOR-3 bacterium]
MTGQEYKDRYGSDFYEQRQVKILELRYGVPSRVATMLSEMKSSIGKILFDDTTGTLVLIDAPEKISAMEAVVAREELPTVARVTTTVTKSFTLQHARVEDIEAQLSSSITKEIGSMRVDKRTKTLVVTDLPHNMDKIEKLVEAFDKKPKQVFIEAKIVQVSLSDKTRLGINWDHVFEGVDPRFSVKTVSRFPIATEGEVGSLTYRTVGGAGSLNVILDALKTVGDTKILASPHISALDGEEATIKVVKNQPYVERQYESGSTNVVGETYNFVEVGVSLSVTPRISDTGMITVDIKPEISDILEWYRGKYQEGTPVVQKSFAETSVMVKDGETIVIGGLIRNEKGKNVSEIPILGQIPILGLLFRSRGDDVISNETVVFLTPRIVTGEEPFSRTRELEKKLKERRTPDTKS